MATFTPNFEIKLNPDGKKATVNDLSNYPNDQLYLTSDFARSLAIVDSVGATVLNLNLTNTTGTFNVASDVWASATFTLTGIGTRIGINFTKTLIFPLDRISKNLFLTELSLNGCCVNPNNRDIMIDADLFFTGMDFAAPTGEGIRWQSYANTANSLLISIT